MTELLYLKDSYLKETKAKVIEISKGVVLDRTIFYPTSGGQPNDLGYIDGYKVTNVFKEDGKVYHIVDGNLQPGQEVTLKIDWERRYTLMRYHTAAHILAGAVFYKKYGAKITGNQLGLEYSRFDFNLENFDKDLMMKAIQEANEIIKKNVDVEIFFIKKEDLKEDMIKLAEARIPDTELLRVVKIGEYDIQIDGGTHVKNTSEIGEIVPIKFENKGKANRKLYFKLI